MPDDDGQVTYDVAVVGGGIVGLATARALLRERPGSRVVVLEKADEVGTGQTGHNSGVIHAGLYYAPGSLKARLCRAGERATKEFCAEHGIEVREIGKLVVATDHAEKARLATLAANARENGIEVREVGAAELREMEPHVTGVAALHSPRSAVVDFGEVARALADEVSELGGEVRVRSEVAWISETETGVDVSLEHGEALRARRLVACAGLQADRVAAKAHVATDVKIVPFKGEYYTLPGHRAGLVSRLIYPVPGEGLPFLGVHITPTVDGRILLGPNAVLALSREKTGRFGFDADDARDAVSFGGLWKMGQKHWRSGVKELWNSFVPDGYLAEVSKYCPDLNSTDLVGYRAGVRAQAVRPDGSLVEDFEIASTPRQVHVLNAPSPAATAAIPIGEEIVTRVWG
ncbi:MAG: L-2-hydroxyglutarate oxidase [Actinomycetaceae bacterium]